MLLGVLLQVVLLEQRRRLLPVCAVIEVRQIVAVVVDDHGLLLVAAQH